MEKNKESKTPSPKLRSPLLSGSNFLHRLAKSEEKKAMSSAQPILGERITNSVLKYGKDADKCNENPENSTTKGGDKGDKCDIAVKTSLKEEATLPKSVNILVNCNGVKTGNNIPTTVVTSPGEDHGKLMNGSKLLNGDCQLPTTNNPNIKSPFTSKRKAISYIEDDTQEFVVVPIKPKKTTPLTEHQKERMLQRKSDIPALYQDLSQDTQQSISNLIISPNCDVVTPENRKTPIADYSLNSCKFGIKEQEKKLNASKESVEVIDETPPPCRDMLITPVKNSPHLTASKKLNFEGLVKAVSPLYIEKQTSEQSDECTPVENNSATPKSRRMFNRKSTSKYGMNRVITPVKDEQIISANEVNVVGDFSSSYSVNKKNFVKQGVSGTKLQKDDLAVDTGTSEETDLLTSKVSLIETLSSTEILSVDSVNTSVVLKNSVERNDQAEENEIIDTNKGEINPVGNDSSDKGETNENATNIECKVRSTSTLDNPPSASSLIQTDRSDKINKAVENINSKQNEKIIKTDLKVVEDFLPKQLKELNENKNEANSLDAKFAVQKEPFTEQEKAEVTNEQLSSNVAVDKGNGSNDNKTPPSQRPGRRPRKVQPSPFSPKLTRSKKLSLQNKSPRSPNEPKQKKIRAPKPNTESFLSDSNSNDSLNGVISLEKVTANAKEINSGENVIKEDKTVNDLKEEKASENNLINQLNNTTAMDTTDLEQIANNSEKNKENLAYEEKLDQQKLPNESNANLEIKRKSRKRKFPSSPGEVSAKADSQEMKLSKRGRGRGKVTGLNRSNSHSPKLSSGLDHWLYKKDKQVVNSENEVASVTKKQCKDVSNTVLTTSESNMTVESKDDEKMSIKQEHENTNVQQTEETKLPESVDHEMNLIGELENKTNQDEDKSQKISTVESESEKTLGVAPDVDIVGSSQSDELTEGLFGSVTKKTKRSTPEPAGAKSSSDITNMVTKVEKISKGMKACDLIFKDAEVEEKITIYMEQTPFHSSLQEIENEDQFSKPLEMEVVSTETVINETLDENDEETRPFAFGGTTECTCLDSGEDITKDVPVESSSPPILNTTESELEQLIKNCENISIPKKCIENIEKTSSMMELGRKDIVLIQDIVEESPEISKQSSFSKVLEEEILNTDVQLEVREKNIGVEMEMAGKNGRIGETCILDSPRAKTAVEKMNEIGLQNDSEHLFKIDATPKKRGARFIHTTEKEEDGGDTAEDRKRRNIRIQRSSLEEVSTVGAGSGGRSKHMVQLAQQGRNSRVSIPRKRRPSIVPITYGANWPTGPSEEWIGVRPSTPGLCSSPGILKQSPISTPTSITSPPQKKKRVNFLDPPVSTGLLYEKGSKVGIGQLHYAEISPGKDLLWNGEELTDEQKSKKTDRSLGDPQWHKKVEEPTEELEPTYEVEVLSSDESIEVIVSEGEMVAVEENLTLFNEEQGIENRSTIEMLTKPEQQTVSEEITVTTDAVSPGEEETTVVNNPYPEKETTEECSRFDVIMDDIFKEENVSISKKIPSIEQLKLYVNNKEFLNNLSIAIRSSGEPLDWCREMFISLTSKK